jgi:hypothetical protein
MTKATPWITTIKNDKGVTLADVCTILWKECVIFLISFSYFHSPLKIKSKIFDDSYSENSVTELEFSSLPGRYQDLVRRQAGLNQHAMVGVASPRAAARAVMRSDWFREKQ